MAQQPDQSIPIEIAIRDLKSRTIDEKKVDAYLDVLEEYECWKPLFRLLFAKIKDSARRRARDYVRLARIYAICLEDTPKVAETCRDLVKNHRLSYQEFRQKVLVKLLGEDDFGKEAQILESIKPVLTTQDEKIACTERLCLIYEKKKYDEDGLNRSYEALIKLDQNNLKALRYFKAVYTQNQAWENVVEVLKKLYKGAKHVNDGYRIAQELATVYLFQMDLPEQSISVLEKYCKDSPLDTSSIHYEAYYRLKNWKGCLEVLESYLPKVEGNTNRAIIYLKIGELQELIGEQERALESYRVSAEAQPRILEPLENMVEIHIHNQNWKQVVECLQLMKSQVDEEQLKERLQEAVTRLEGEISHG
ncbi:tetratricopeptide repeat protein [Pseudobacteriovorax antillogorgiicola]|uniref:Tetratricopeptide repeat-containing protein n=1 Tax=Pseudobacteriovorax antillogorgiicola TaxID=1513793 RepID=A0A1Y6BAA4_9BACT|nr:hypothetical protein [Pseudobacteriovorax antillogorgiicola]TCS59261.1 hypothetical protein EDD56_101166 [Pseudobacteriovorax antillogorgiicola]SME89941.1 hypothetical protein SAMN06296036_101320 [Pseudobacteriovorax antillogorgiicola]